MTSEILIPSRGVVMTTVSKLWYNCTMSRGKLHSDIWWRGGVVVIRLPHDPEVPSSNPGKNNTSDFSCLDPLSLPSCDWYRVYLVFWRNGSGGRAASFIYTCQARGHGFNSRCFPQI